MRKLFLAAGVATIGMLTAVMPAAAWWNWCEEDPVVSITTPGQNHVTVYVTIQAIGITDPTLLAGSTVAYQAQASRNATTPTEVSLEVTTPQLATHYRSRIIVSSQPLGAGHVYAMSQGFSDNHHAEVDFGLPVR